MAEIALNRDELCIYCRGPAKRLRDGEHVLPQAIGGALTIIEKSGKRVCHKCNNGPLSVIDNELCGRSYLALIASQEIDASLWQVWDVDHDSGGQLVEAKPSWTDGELSGLVSYPQIPFGPNGPEIRGDALEAAKFGRESFETVLFKAAHQAYLRYNAGVKGMPLFFEQIDSPLVFQDYKYDPRAYTRHTISEIASKIDRQSFVIRYASREDKRKALRQLSNLEPRRRMNSWTKKRGSRLPPIASLFDLGRTVRGLMKIGLNLLATYCTNTPVSRDTFSGVVRLILGENHPSSRLLASNGFVYADDLMDIREDQGHAFRLTYLDGNWRVYSSFFGGRLGAFVSFPGPNGEHWRTLDVVAPLHSKEWRVTTSSIIRTINVHPEWGDLRRIAPTIKLQESYSKLSVERVPLKPPRG